eukprot:11626591-Heterocapsa_arctica.AAC.1
MASGLPRLQWQSRTSGHRSRNHSENTRKPVSTRKQELMTRLVNNIQLLGLSVRDNINIIKAAGQSRATYGAA